MRKLFFILIAALLTVASYSKEETQPDLYLMNRKALLMMDTGDTITVVGHKSQDPDAVCSAIAMSELMNLIGMKAKPVLQNEATQGVKYILDEFNYKYPQVQISIDKDKPLMMVDHNDPLQSLKGMSDAKIVGLVDHHGISESFSTGSPIYIRTANVASTNTLVYNLYADCGIVPSKQIAGLMLSGIIADTDSLSKKTTTDIDRQAVAKLLEISGSDFSALAKGIMHALSCYDGMTDKQILESDMKEYIIEGVHLAVANVSASADYPAETLLKRVSTAIPAVMSETEVSMFFSIISDSENVRSLIPFSGEGAKEVLEKAYPEGTIEGEHMVINAVVGRKSSFIPRITEALK